MNLDKSWVTKEPINITEREAIFILMGFAGIQINESDKFHEDADRLPYLLYFCGVQEHKNNLVCSCNEIFKNKGGYCKNIQKVSYKELFNALTERIHLQIKN